MKNIVIASNNAGKIKEIQAILADAQITLIPQGQLAVDDIEETGSTFLENALLKARHASQCTGLPALADDSGLCVPALNGAPGIYSARYAGVGASSKQHWQKLLAAFSNSAQDRQAYFYCCLVLVNSPTDSSPIIAEGYWHGKIAEQASGEHGFGYDPIFYLPELKCTAAELDAQQKNQLSHRAAALKILKQKITTKKI